MVRPYFGGVLEVDQLSSQGLTLAGLVRLTDAERWPSGWRPNSPNAAPLRFAKAAAGTPAAFVSSSRDAGRSQQLYGQGVVGGDYGGGSPL